MLNRVFAYLNNAAVGAVPAVPVVSAISPSRGDTAGGGGRVVITVNSSVGCTGATLLGTALASFAIDDATHVSGVPGAHASGTGDVVVTNATGPSTTGTNLFKYWTPAELASGLRYLDSNKGVTDAGAGAVSAWLCQISAVSYAQAVGGSRPTQTASVFSGTIPSIRFVQDRFLTGTDVGALSPYAVFAVAAWTDTDATAGNAVFNVPLTIFGASGGWSGIGASADVIRHKVYDRTLIDRGSGLNDGVPHLIGVTADATPDFKHYVGATQQGATESSGGDVNLYCDSVGAGLAGGDGFAGDLGAWIIASSISAPELFDLDEWAKQRFGAV